MVPILTLLNSKRIIKHYWKILSFAIFQKVEISLKNLKMVKNQQKKFKKVIFVTKIPNTFDFYIQKPKKNRHVFLGLFTWNHPGVTCHVFLKT